MDLIMDTGEKVIIQEHCLRHLTHLAAEKMAVRQQKLPTPFLPHLIAGLHRRCNDRQASPCQDHQLPQPANYHKKGLSRNGAGGGGG